MYKILVGLDGWNTPDPAYWAARNEVIVAEDLDTAVAIWKNNRVGWLSSDEHIFIKARIIPDHLISRSTDPTIWNLISEWDEEIVDQQFPDKVDWSILSLDILATRRASRMQWLDKDLDVDEDHAERARIYRQLSEIEGEIYRREELELWDEEQQIWDSHTIPEVMESLLSWGYGSGEELFHFLTEDVGISSKEATSFSRHLNSLLARYKERQQ